MRIRAFELTVRFGLPVLERGRDASICCVSEAEPDYVRSDIITVVLRISPRRLNCPKHLTSDGEILNTRLEQNDPTMLQAVVSTSPITRHSSVTHTVSLEAVRSAVYEAQRFLLDRQDPEGYWVAELEGDSILESEYILLMQFLGHRDTEKFRKLTNYIRRWQHPDGYWPIYPGGPPDVSASVKAYFACKLAGYTGNEPFMRRARKAILAQGGVTRCNTFTKLYLSMFGQYDWHGVPTIPPETILLPK